MKIKKLLILLIISFIFILGLYESYYIKQFKKIDLSFDIHNTLEMLSLNLPSLNDGNNDYKNYNNASDKEIGIIITNKGNMYFDVVDFGSKNPITLTVNNNSIKSDTIHIEAKDVNKKDKIELKSESLINISNISDYWYDGFFEIYKTKKGLVLVNRINLENYIAGVVSSEMPASFEKEALKAQAICARTFTYRHLENKKYSKYDAIMDDTTSYQAYGTTKIHDNVKKAVKETENTVITCKGKLINSCYFSTSCGMTTNYKIWDSKMPYLKSVCVSEEQISADSMTGDFFDSYFKTKPEAYENKCPYYRWRVEIPNQAVTNKIYEQNNVLVGDIQNISVKERNAGGSVKTLVVTGNVSEVTIEGQYNIRKVLCPFGCDLVLNDDSVKDSMTMLPSAFISVECKEDKTIIFGGGFGHGSGMSQYGANELAKNGLDAGKIIEYFYQGVHCDYRYKD